MLTVREFLNYYYHYLALSFLNNIKLENIKD